MVTSSWGGGGGGGGTEEYEGAGDVVLALGLNFVGGWK